MHPSAYIFRPSFELLKARGVACQVAGNPGVCVCDVQYRDRAAARAKERMKQKELGAAEHKRQSKDQDKLARLQKEYARSVPRSCMQG